jgi:hypothetical protein
VNGRKGSRREEIHDLFRVIGKVREEGESGGEARGRPQAARLLSQLQLITVR